MAKTVTCLYNSDNEASSIIRQLDDAGISESKICHFTHTGDHHLWADTSNVDEASATGGDRVANFLSNNGVPADDAHAYAEGVRRGHALIAVRCDDDEVDRVVDILDNDATLDIDEQQDAWRSEGWGDYNSRADASITTSAGMLGGGMQARDQNLNEDGDQVIPVAEEELHVGKRDVSRGRVRVKSHVIERPVQEQVSLTEERVAVERRPVEGSMRSSALGNETDPFRERTIEMEERAEEAVVSKEARIVEEVVLRKEANRHTETISDTVRKTEVDIEDERGNTIPQTGTKDGRR